MIVTDVNKVVMTTALEVTVPSYPYCFAMIKQEGVVDPASIIKIAMSSVSAELRRKGLKSKLILHIHDELIVEGPESEAGDVREILEKCMMGAADLAVDLVCDIHTGKTWYELK